MRNYRTWRKANPQPVRMAETTATLCVGPPEWQAQTNPHYVKFISVYSSPGSEQAMARKGSTSFPVGTVIVKEKLTGPKSQDPELLTVMSKRGEGVWEYYTVSGDGTAVDASQAKSCASCHTAAAKNDFVFRTYVKGAARPERWTIKQ